MTQKFNDKTRNQIDPNSTRPTCSIVIFNCNRFKSFLAVKS